MSDSNPIIHLFIVVGLLAMTGQSMRFELKSGHTKCISEDIKQNAMTVGKYTLVNPNEGYPLPDNHKVTVRVTSPYGNGYHAGENVESGNFAFTAPEAGDYSTCFWALEDKNPFLLTIDFEWKTGVHAKDWSKIAKKGQIDVPEMILDDIDSLCRGKYFDSSSIKALVSMEPVKLILLGISLEG